jgi:hypothetical protein
MRELIFVLALALLAGCSGIFGQRGAASRPEDFQVQYEWSEGSLPPPYHYEYTVLIGPDGQGEVRMTPDYPGPDVPTWTETFSLTPEEMDSLYAGMAAQGLEREKWAEEDDPPVGGSSAWMVVTSRGKEIRIPSFVPARQAAKAQALGEAVVSAVPQPFWDSLNARREAYMVEHPDR